MDYRPSCGFYPEVNEAKSCSGSSGGGWCFSWWLRRAKGPTGASYLQEVALICSQALALPPASVPPHPFSADESLSGMSPSFEPGDGDALRTRLRQLR